MRTPPEDKPTAGGGVADEEANLDEFEQGATFEGGKKGDATSRVESEPREGREAKAAEVCAHER